jgi:hypothetical protein
MCMATSARLPSNAMRRSVQLRGLPAPSSSSLGVGAPRLPWQQLEGVAVAAWRADGAGFEPWKDEGVARLRRWVVFAHY